MFVIEELNNPEELKKLIDTSNIDEDFDYNADFYHVGREAGKIVGVIVYKLQSFKDGTILPRFIHVIFDKSIQRTKKIILLLLKSQKIIKELGYNQMFCLVKEDKQEMIIYAKKFGFKEWTSSEHGKLFYKNIGE